MRYIFCLVIVCSSLACHKSEIKILTEEKISDVLVDLTVSDQVINLHQPHERDSIREVLMQSLLKIHDLERSELDTNLYIYMSDFERFSRINKNVMSRIDSLISIERN